MSECAPSLGEEFSLSIDDSDGSVLGECSELGATTWSSLKPNDERNSIIFFSEVVTHCAEELIEHLGLALGMVPIDLLVAYC